MINIAFNKNKIYLDTTIKINIVNLTKKNNHYNEGCQPLVFSMNHYKETGIG